MTMLDPRVQLHAFNTAFSWSDLAGPFRLVTDQQARQYDEQGFFLLDDVFTTAELAAVRAEIDPREAEMDALLHQVEGGKLFIARADEITFTVHLAAQSAVLREFVSGRVFRDLCADLIGPDVRLYWDQAVYKKPDTEAPFPWHQDNGYAFVEPQQYLTCWVPLTDATVDNGCPWVVPGLHRFGTFAHTSTDIGLICLEDAPDAVPVEAPAGSLVVFSSLTPHSTGPNTTDQVRKSYIVQFAPDGAAVRTGADLADPAALTSAAHPDRQFPILVGGEIPPR